MTPREVFAQANARIGSMLDEAVDDELFTAWGAAAHELYAEQFAKKENPYGEPWEYKKGDEKRTKSYSKLGAPTDVSRDGFSLVVASPRPNRSCVPYEPRGLGRWRSRFDEILQNRAHLLFRNVRP